jgi:hypothetical protein
MAAVRAIIGNGISKLEIILSVKAAGLAAKGR